MLDILLVYGRRQSIPFRDVMSITYLQELVGHLLVLLGHGVWGGLGRGSDETEDGEAGTEA